MTLQIRSRIEYLIPFYNVFVFVLHSNLALLSGGLMRFRPIDGSL